MAPSGNVDSVLTYFLKLGEDCCSKKELPEGIYNYETVLSGIQIIIEFYSGIFDIVQDLSMCGYAYQSDDV